MYASMQVYKCVCTFKPVVIMPLLAGCCNYNMNSACNYSQHGCSEFFHHEKKENELKIEKKWKTFMFPFTFLIVLHGGFNMNSSLVVLYWYCCCCLVSLNLLSFIFFFVVWFDCPCCCCCLKIFACFMLYDSLYCIAYWLAGWLAGWLVGWLDSWLLE